MIITMKHVNKTPKTPTRLNFKLLHSFRGCRSQILVKMTKTQPTGSIYTHTGMGMSLSRFHGPWSYYRDHNRPCAILMYQLSQNFLWLPKLIWNQFVANKLYNPTKLNIPNALVKLYFQSKVIRPIMGPTRIPTNFPTSRQIGKNEFGWLGHKSKMYLA